MGLSGRAVRLGIGVAYQANTQECHDTPQHESDWEHAGITERSDDRWENPSSDNKGGWHNKGYTQVPRSWIDNVRQNGPDGRKECRAEHRLHEKSAPEEELRTRPQHRSSHSIEKHDHCQHPAGPKGQAVGQFSPFTPRASTYTTPLQRTASLLDVTTCLSSKNIILSETV